MTEYAALRTKEGATLMLGAFTLEATSPRVERGAIRATLSVYNGHLLFRDTVNLTSIEGRAKIQAALIEKEIRIEAEALLALEEACRHRPLLVGDSSSTSGQPEASCEEGHKILDDVHAFLGRFVSYPDRHAQVAHTLWIGHTHLMDASESTPRIACRPSRLLGRPGLWK